MKRSVVCNIKAVLIINACVTRKMSVGMILIKLVVKVIMRSAVQTNKEEMVIAI